MEKDKRISLLTLESGCVKSCGKEAERDDGDLTSEGISTRYI